MRTLAGTEPVYVTLMHAVSRSPGLALLSDSIAAPPSLSLSVMVPVLKVLDVALGDVKVAQARGPRLQPSSTKAAIARANRRAGRRPRRLPLTASAPPLTGFHP